MLFRSLPTHRAGGVPKHKIHVYLIQSNLVQEPSRNVTRL